MMPVTESSFSVPTLHLQYDTPGAVPTLLATTSLPAEATVLTGTGEGLRWRLTLRPLPGQIARWRGELVVEVTTAAELALTVALTGLGPQPRWLIPATFYDQNRPADSPRRYPRWGFDDDPWSAPAWCFSAERAAAPFTSLQSEHLAAALLADSPYWRMQPLGLGLDAAHDSTLLLRYPFAETPRSDAPCRGDGCKPVVAWHQVLPGETLHLAFEVWLQEATRGPLYGALLRAVAARNDPATRHSTSPWMPMDAASTLLSEGLLRWHYDPETAVLAETCAFDHYFRPTDRQTDRAAMHVAWLSGIPTAFALLRQSDAAKHAGQQVIDHIAREGLAPCGAFWAQWTPAGWGTCWYGPPEGAPPWLQATTCAEATMFLLQAATHMREQGHPQPAWEAAARSNLDFAATHQRADGNLGAYYDARSGDVTLWDGTAGLLWIAALVAGWQLDGDQRYLQAALRAAAYYAPLVRSDSLRGAPEDVPLGPTSMDGYCALRAYWDLFAATGDRRWLELARHAADWTLTFRWAYNVRFDRRTFLGSCNFCTIGGDLASPSNQHLHVYGMVALPELLQLWRTSGDDLYFDAAANLLGFARQTLARVDGEGNARRGMYSEQWYHVDWTHPKGSMLQLAHAWCNGLAIYGFQEAHRFGELWLGERVHCLEPSALADSAPDPARLRLHNPFAEPLTLRVRLSKPWHGLWLDGEILPLHQDTLGPIAEVVLMPEEERVLAAVC